MSTLRPRSVLRPKLLAVILCLLCASCASSVELGQDMEEYRDEVTRLQKRLVDNPDDAEARRELGIIYLQTRRYAEAYDQLQEAYARDDEDPRTLFYLGMASEIVGERQEALQLYEQYPEVSRLSPYRQQMEGRYRWLIRQLARDQMEKLLEEEQQRGGDISPSIVAVFPFNYQGSNEQYAPLGRGLSEMLTVDLANVEQIKVVERARLQALLDELELSQSEYVDPETAPRVGRLLGAGRLIGGSYNVLSDDQLRLDAALTQLGDEALFPELESRTDALDNLFRLEKELVFRLIEELDVELTPSEREAIEKVPTQNLQAFLAYSRGLELEASGNFSEAAQAYSQAHQIDPSFEGAQQQANAASSLDAAGGEAEQTLEATLEGETLETSSIDLMDRRQRTLNESTGGLYLPGEEARQPATEAAAEVTLPDPPPPPPGGGEN